MTGFLHAKSGKDSGPGAEDACGAENPKRCTNVLVLFRVGHPIHELRCPDRHNPLPSLRSQASSQRMEFINAA